MWGLGNQMFQYAFAYSVSQRANVLLKIDISVFDSDGLRQYELGNYCVNVEVATEEEVCRLKYQAESLLKKFIRKLAKEPKQLAKSYCRESGFEFDECAFNQSLDVYFDGYWQSEKYFLAYREGLLKQFCLKAPLHTKSKSYQQKIRNEVAISLHVRRGDYVSNARTNSVHGTCSLDYYKQAVGMLESKLTRPHFFVFSDDTLWAKKNLRFIKKATFVDLKMGRLDHEEMWLMSQCQHHIIANSSFSWWGAWLNDNPTKIVVAPKRWFKDQSINTADLIPDAWVCL